MRPMLRVGAVAGLVAMALAGPAVGVSAAAASRDTNPPRVRFTTNDDAILVGAAAGGEWTELRGTATDIGGSGVSRVTLIYCANAWKTENGMGCGTGPIPTVKALFVREATMLCVRDTHRRCSWSVRAPLQPGQYLVMATATDASGNERSTRPIFVTVL